MSITRVFYPTDGPPVARTAAETFCRRRNLAAPTAAAEPGAGVRVGVAGGGWALGPSAPPEGAWMWARLGADGQGELSASEPALLYALVELLADGLGEAHSARLEAGLLLQPAFDWNRPLFDLTLTQTARTARGFDPEGYVRRLAACGFTHLEVNGLAFHLPLEYGVPDEYYAQFYSYCPAMNQFVDSPLTRGLYPIEYLAANLNRLKRTAALGRAYGLRPGLLCFEPRTLPETFFERYPTLRGARVDHPFRSYHPRYTLAQDHPATHEHYRHLVTSLLREVPDLAYLSVWTNDSGAGFEHTASLYVGRNGGPYLIREWRSHEKIAEAAGQSAVRFLRTVREAAAEINPDFEVSLRIEPFKVEHDTILAGMGDGLTIETPSLLVRGYHLPYAHPRYPEQQSVAGTIFHQEMDPSEAEKLEELRARDVEPLLHYSPGSGFNTEPLLGLPFPRMLHRKLASLRALGARRVSAFGGLLHLERTPYWPNPEVIRAAQLTPDRPVDEVLHAAAARWAGPEQADALVTLWDEVDEAVGYIPVLPLYSNFGFVWYRLWTRPFVPDIEAIPADERAYYQRFVVTTPNNPSINDLGRDVLFQLLTEESGRQMKEGFDRNVLPRLDAALRSASALAETAGEPARAVFTDLRDRLRAARSWSTTMRNTCAWVEGVYGFLRAETDGERERARGIVREMVASELANARELLDLWQTSRTELFLVSDVGETSFIYGENFGDLLREKIRLTEAYGDRDPYIDPDILWRL